MGVNLFNFEDLHAFLFEEVVEACEGVVEEVFVIDHVKGHLFHHFQKVGNLYYEYAFGFEEEFDVFDDVFNGVCVGKDVVCCYDVCTPFSFDDFIFCLLVKEAVDGGYAVFFCDFGDVFCRFNSDCLYCAFLKSFEEKSIITTDVDCQ